jgi:hypothetical protein
MRRGSLVVGVLGMAVAVASGATVRPLAAQQSASQLVIFHILPASHASVSPVVKPMSLRGERGESRTSWSIATNQPDRKILASLDRALPRGSTLVVTLAAPTGATSAGPVVLDTVATDVVMGIPVTAQSELPLRYIVNADPAAGSRAPADAQQVTVTYTVVEEP